MTATKHNKNGKIPKRLLEAIDSGELTVSELRELIALEAREIDLTYDEAVDRAKKNTLPKDSLGSDIQFLVKMLPA